MTDERSKVRDRIRKLHARQTSRGFTEAEALQAAEAAAQLMREHGLTEDDLVMNRRESETRGGPTSVRASLWGAVAMATNCAATFSTSGRTSTIIWIGRDPGPELAVYLQAMLSRAVDREVTEFRKSKFYRQRRTAKTKAQAVKEFTYALIGRLSRRLLDMFRQTRSEQALEAARAASDRAFPSARPVRSQVVKERFSEARDHGWAAGGRVGIRRGVGADDGPAGAIERPRLQIEGPR